LSDDDSEVRGTHPAAPAQPIGRHATRGEKATGGQRCCDPARTPNVPHEPQAAATSLGQVDRPPRPIVRLMRLLAKGLRQDPGGENAVAVRLFRVLDATLDLLKAGPLRRRFGAPTGRIGWPLAPGDYRVGDPSGSVAVCTLSSRDLIAPLAALPGVAIAGRLVTVNLGIERMVTNIAGNPAIRALVLCGADSPVFDTAQGVRSLLENGVAADRRIIAARGHLPVLRGLPVERIERFRRQVVLVDASGVTDVAAIARTVADAVERAAALPPLPATSDFGADQPAEPTFKRIPSGGHREPIGYDPKGFFIITLDRPAGEILCRHYLSDNTPAHEIRSHSAERILLGLLRAKLVSQLGHAGYLGAELAKAETALRLGLDYEQDRRLVAPTGAAWSAPVAPAHDGTA
jgi:tetrahydromethanopterin S-methyltransferase subunit A